MNKAPSNRRCRKSRVVLGSMIAAALAGGIGGCGEKKANGGGKVKLEVWQSADGIGGLVKQDDAALGDNFDFSGPVVQVSSKTAQEIKGFGGAFTEASALVYQNLTSAQQKQLLEDYYGPNGIGYTLGRTHINSCDFAVSSYSFDDVANDTKLEHFDMELKHDATVLLPLIKAAQGVLQKQGKELSLLASPWSPPAWMKNQTWNFKTSTMDHSGSPCLLPGMAAVWAKYFSKWIDAHKAKDIPIWAVTIQNEPENNASWEACMMTAEEQADFLANHLGPELNASHPDVGIFLFDHNKDHVYNYSKTVLSDPKAAEYATGVAFRWYTGDSFENVEKIQAEFPKHQLLASEATWEAYRWKKGTVLETGDWAFGEGYAHDIIGDLNRGTIGWIDWNLILNEIGGPNHVDNVCDAAIQTNFSKGEVYKHPQYYYIGHFSKFILPGSLRLETTVENTTKYEGKEVRPYGTCTKDDGLQATAAKRPDGKVAVVVLNCGDDAIDFKLQVASSAAKLQVPAHGIQTYIVEGEAQLDSGKLSQVVV